jgi:heat-inducible transcriptional repressor
VLTIGAIVRSVTLELEREITREELDRVARLLRERLLGHAIDGVRKRLAADDALVRDAAAALVAEACLEALAGAARPDVYAFGSTHVARHPDLQSRLAPVLALIDRPEPWEDLVAAETAGTVTVTIGREHARPELAHLSLVRFRVDGPVGASIGLLGPLRMDYGRAIGLVDFVGRRLSSLL